MDGISKAIQIGLSKLLSLDPFKDILVGEENVNFVTNQCLSGKEVPHVNNYELDDNYDKV